MKQRSFEEIEAMAKFYKENPMYDQSGFRYVELIHCLPYKDARKYWSTIRSMWKRHHRNRKHCLNLAKGEIVIAWDHANKKQPSLVQASLDMIWVYLWMVDDHKLFDFDHYRYYGKDLLEKICNHYKWDWRLWDDGFRVNR